MRPNAVTVQVRRLRPDAILPVYAHPDDAGMDLASVEPVRLVARGRAAVGTGLAVAIPPGWVGLVHPRSGLARRHGITVANAPGTIDAGYRGELQVLLVNLSDEDYSIDAGERIAQLVVQPVAHADLVEVDALDTTLRGDSGFGSTGRR
ncbi:MAG: dUTP diphosphatase [Nitriliruptoraceae bacterium]